MIQQNAISKNERIYPKRPPSWAVCPFRAHLSIVATFEHLTMVETFFASVLIIEGQSIIEKNVNWGIWFFLSFSNVAWRTWEKPCCIFLGSIRHNEPRASLRWCSFVKIQGIHFFLFFGKSYFCCCSNRRADSEAAERSGQGGEQQLFFSSKQNYLFSLVSQ